MNRRSIPIIVATLAALLFISGCGSKLGSSASPPNNLLLNPGDSSFTATWTMAGNVQYWLVCAPGDQTTDTNVNANSLTNVLELHNASSPYLVSFMGGGLGLANGSTYSCFASADVNGGPSGSGTPTAVVVPRLAGAIWNAGTSLGSNLAGVTSNTTGTTLVAVGAGGVIYSGTSGLGVGGVISGISGINWTPQINPSSPTANLNAVSFGGTYVAVGSSGALLTSSDAVTWTPQTSNTPYDLYAVASNGSGQYVAAGKNGTIISGSASTWGTVYPGNGYSLNALTYGNGRFVAVGDNGSLLTSIDSGNSWQSAYAGTSVNLHGIAFGGLFVAVGDNGTVVTSLDGVTWSAATPVPSTNILTAIDFGHQFVAVGKQGGLFTSVDGVTWVVQPQAPYTRPTSNNLNAVTHTPFGYVAVGDGGTNLSSF